VSKNPASQSGDIFWKHIYILLCGILLCLTAVQLFLCVTDPYAGMDYRVYKAGVQLFNQGLDPYPLENIHQITKDVILYTYPPHTLLFYWVLQFFFIFQSIWIYYGFLIELLIASGYIIATLDNKPEYLFLITLILTGFVSTYWNFYTGNKDIMFLFLFAGIFYLLLKEKFWQSSIVMGLMGSFTLVTLPFVALYLAIRKPIVDRIKYILLSVGVVAAIFLISWLLNPALFESYLETLQGSTSPLFDKPGIWTPTPFLIFGLLLNQKNGGMTIPMILVSLVYAGIVIAASWYIIKKSQENPLRVYSLTMFAIIMVMPRLKPYYFIILALPLYFIFKDCNYKIKILVLTVISLIPLCVWFYSEAYRATPLPNTISAYIQTISLFVIFAITVVFEYYRPVSLPSSPS
jgi:hypothetical protein